MSTKHKRYREDGTFYYYYYRKKTRKKKRGPKTKKSKGKAPYDGTWNFKILRFVSKKQVGYIGKYRKYEDAYKRVQEELKKYENVEFPIMSLNNSSTSGEFNEPDSEIVILKKIRNENESNESLVRNKYGKYVKHITNSEKYYIYEKFPYREEETFWVYGYSPNTQRKTYKWVYENLIDGEKGLPFIIINVYLYNNKVIFRYDDERFEFVICKNVSDAIRFYNLLNERYKKEKNVIFTGMVKGTDDRGRATIQMIKERTGWDYNKIYKKNTVK